MTVDEKDLLAALRRRDPAAFATVFDRYADKIYRLSVGLLQDEQEADAIVQETFLRLFERLETFQGRSSLGTWLYRVAYNRTMDQLRRRRPEQLPSGEEVALIAPSLLVDWGRRPEQALTDAELRVLLDGAIAALPEHYRIVFILREIEGLSTEETAAIVDISISAAKVRLHRARLFLRERLAEQFAELAAG